MKKTRSKERLERLDRWLKSKMTFSFWVKNDFEKLPMFPVFNEAWRRVGQELWDLEYEEYELRFMHAELVA